MKTLILVDLQNDFLSGGALAVPNGEEVIAVANRLMPHFDLVLATQDWHPADHDSFAANHPGERSGEVIDLHGLRQILWPAHCVQNTPGAGFAAALDLSSVEKVFRKGTDLAIDSYSGFFDNARRKATGLGEYLHDRGVDQVHVMGLATDYCVKFTALDARSLGFGTTVILDGCRGVELEPGDVDRAVEEMKQAGVIVSQSSTIAGAD